MILCLQLSKKARLDNRVEPVQLPKNEIQIKDKGKCRVAGWGYTRTRGKVVDVLQVVEVPIVNLEVCKTVWDHRGLKLPDNVICAGGYRTDKGFCQVRFLSIYRKCQLLFQRFLHSCYKHVKSNNE